MIRCSLLHSNPLGHVSLFLLRAWLAPSTYPFRALTAASFASTSKRTRYGSADESINIKIETNLDHRSAVTASGAVDTPELPSPTNSSHRDLPTFLTHARRTGLSTTSTVYRGTYYEYLTVSALRQYAFELVKVGGAGDKGIDLVGFWNVPSVGGTSTATTQAEDERGGAGAGAGESHQGVHTEKLRVLLQCKRLGLKSALGPNLMRELEGAMRGAGVPIGWRGPGVLGILVGTRAATKGVRAAMAETRRAMGWIMLEMEEGTKEGSSEDSNNTGDGVHEEDHQGEALEADSHVGKVRQILWNSAASRLGLEGLDVVAKHDAASAGTKGDGHEGAKKEVVLMWQGKVLSGSDEK